MGNTLNSVILHSLFSERIHRPYIFNANVDSNWSFHKYSVIRAKSISIGVYIYPCTCRCHALVTRQAEVSNIENDEPWYRASISVGCWWKRTLSGKKKQVDQVHTVVASDKCHLLLRKDAQERFSLYYYILNNNYICAEVIVYTLHKKIWFNINFVRIKRFFLLFFNGSMKSAYIYVSHYF